MHVPIRPEHIICCMLTQLFHCLSPFRTVIDEVTIYGQSITSMLETRLLLQERWTALLVFMYENNPLFSSCKVCFENDTLSVKIESSARKSGIGWRRKPHSYSTTGRIFLGEKRGFIAPFPVHFVINPRF